jgi:hypothetical protein
MNFDEEVLYTVGQLADMLGCSVRSIYRWEEQGVIPPPTRIDRGEVSARVYSTAQVADIRAKVQGRISFTALVRERRTPRRISEQRPVIHLKKKDIRRKRRPSAMEEVTMDPAWAPTFMKALAAANKDGCTSLVLIDGTGRVQTFTTQLIPRAAQRPTSS